MRPSTQSCLHIVNAATELAVGRRGSSSHKLKPAATSVCRAAAPRALRETETETDRFAINRKPTDVRFSKKPVFGFPDSGQFCLLWWDFSEFFFACPFLESFFCSDECVIILIFRSFTWLSRILVSDKGFLLGTTSNILLYSATTKL
jgi:hypothetical protein